MVPRPALMMTVEPVEGQRQKDSLAGQSNEFKLAAAC